MKTVVQISFIIALLFTQFTSFSQKRKSGRQPVANGTYYPASNSELRSQLEELFNSVEDITIADNISALIVPDDKIINAGEVTAAAIAKLDPNKQYTRIFIIGTSHGDSFKGISVYTKGNYRTPLGLVRVDNEVIDRLVFDNRAVKYIRKAHREEHSVEVQLPYLQHWLNNSFKIVPLVIGSVTKENLNILAEILEPYFTPNNLFIISSDISESTFKSKEINSAITGNSVDKLLEHVSPETDDESAIVPVGWTSIIGMLNTTSGKENITVEHIKNSNTGNNGALGFHSFIIKNDAEPVTVDINLTQDDMQYLLRLVRQTIRQKMEDNTLPEINENELSENLKIKCGAFVTLTNDGEIRGNMGKFTDDEPLYKVVQEMAVTSAFRDKRYIPIGNNEISEIDIEISVVTPLKQIFSSDEIQMGKHGIYMTMDGRNGKFLPQTARITGWSKEEFLGYCAEDFTGIGWDGWRMADLYTFETFAFNRRTAYRQQ